MARGRMLKKEIANSKKMAMVSDRAKVIYLMMLPHTDVEGRVKACPPIVKGQYLTMLKYTAAMIQKALEELHKVGLIVLYIHNGDQLAEYTRFGEFQNLNASREAESHISPPTPENSCITPENSPLSLSKVKLSKDNMRERFDQFWKNYPKKTGKVKARESFDRIKPTEELFASILAAIDQQKSSTQWRNENGRYIPNPATWLNQGRWDDEPVKTERAVQKAPRCKCGKLLNSGERQDGICATCKFEGAVA